MSQTRLQDEYNKAIGDCDLFVMLFWTKVGQYTEEEFETAFGQFKSTNKPLVFTYFKDTKASITRANKKNLITLWDFQEKLSSLGHFYTVYKNVDELKYKFNQQLDKLATNGLIKLAPEIGHAAAPPYVQTGVTGSHTFITNFYGARLQAEIAKPAGPIPPSPYPGLASFGPKQAKNFFGREQAIRALAASVAKRSFTALVGASGSGKSSVVLAGLAPWLENHGGWRSTYLRIGTEPDKNPFAALARALGPLTGERGLSDQLEEVQKLAKKLAEGSVGLVNVLAACRAANPGKRILLIADQFEEVFTLVPNDALRNRFIDELIEAFPDPATGKTPEISLVLTLRADFYNAALRHRPLADRLQDHVENLGPMTRDELLAAIVKPAEAVGVQFDRGLVDTILDDVEKRPSSLPLLQFALREMWGLLKTQVMTRADYEAIGGVEGSLAKRARTIFDDATNEGKDVVRVALFRRLFTRLVALGEGSEDTRPVVRRDELDPDAWALAQKLADENNRLVVTAAPTPGNETVELVHEALIRNWPTLVEWIDRDRAFQSWVRQLKPRADEWRTNPMDEGTLLRGGTLTVAEEWMARRRNDLSEQEKAFIAASVSARDAERRHEEQRRRARSRSRVGWVATLAAVLALGGAFAAARGDQVAKVGQILNFADLNPISGFRLPLLLLLSAQDQAADKWWWFLDKDRANKVLAERLIHAPRFGATFAATGFDPQSQKIAWVDGAGRLGTCSLSDGGECGANDQSFPALPPQALETRSRNLALQTASTKVVGFIGGIEAPVVVSDGILHYMNNGAWDVVDIADLIGDIATSGVVLFDIDAGRIKVSSSDWKRATETIFTIGFDPNTDAKFVKAADPLRLDWGNTNALVPTVSASGNRAASIYAAERGEKDLQPCGNRETGGVGPIEARALTLTVWSRQNPLWQRALCSTPLPYVNLGLG